VSVLYDSQEAAHGRAVPRPMLAAKLLVYMRGEGTLERRGYFVPAKMEELATRRP
jgi:hypothetical protein